jgi:hypothetical protein
VEVRESSIPPWNLRLFISFDLAGSTEFKSRERQNLIPDWVRTFNEFFREIPSRVGGAYERLPGHFKNVPDNLRGVVANPQSKLSVWKFVGGIVKSCGWR